MKSVFLVKTPLQLINAVEARHYFGLDKKDCILIAMGDRKSQPQILNLAKAIDEWEDVIELNDINLFSGSPFEKSRKISGKIQQLKMVRSSLFYIRRLNKLSNHLGEVKYIFIGYTRYPYMTHFVNITPYEQLFFLDDGNGTIDLAKQRKNEINSNLNIGLRKKIKLLGKKYLLGIKDKEADSACFFTAYDITVGDNDRVVKNDFKYLKSSLNELPVSEEVYFIGSPLSEVGIMEEEDYLAQLRKVKAYFDDAELIYVAHRRDSPSKLDIIRNDLGLKIVLFEYPIEYQLAFIGPRPKVLASFFSAAIDSCRLIFGNRLKIIAFKIDLSASPKREKVESIYDSYLPLVNEHFIVETNF